MVQTKLSLLQVLSFSTSKNSILDCTKILSVPGVDGADSQLEKLGKGYSKWSEDLVSTTSSALHEVIGSASFPNFMLQS